MLGIHWIDSRCIEIVLLSSILTTAFATRRHGGWLLLLSWLNRLLSWRLDCPLGWIVTVLHILPIPQRLRKYKARDVPRTRQTTWGDGAVESNFPATWTQDYEVSRAPQRNTPVPIGIAKHLGFQSRRWFSPSPESDSRDHLQQKFNAQSSMVFPPCTLQSRCIIFVGMVEMIALYFVISRVWKVMDGSMKASRLKRGKIRPSNSQPQLYLQNQANPCRPTKVQLSAPANSLPTVFSTANNLYDPQVSYNA